MIEDKLIKEIIEALKELRHQEDVWCRGDTLDTYRVFKALKEWEKAND